MDTTEEGGTLRSCAWRECQVRLPQRALWRVCFFERQAGAERHLGGRQCRYGSRVSRSCTLNRALASPLTLS
jgi:hypothetical protein